MKSLVWCGPLQYDSVCSNHLVIVPFTAGDGLHVIKNKLKDRLAPHNIDIDRFINDSKEPYGYNGHFGFSWS